MDFTKAKKKQLLQIALREKCPVSFKYEACRELQMRWNNKEMLLDLVRMYGQGKEMWEIAEHLGIKESTVKGKIIQYGLKGRVGA
jgi:DNA-binding NarL/FixJ family response regulator